MNMDEFGVTPEMAQDHTTWKQMIASRAIRHKLEADDNDAKYFNHLAICYVVFSIYKLLFSHALYLYSTCNAMKSNNVKSFKQLLKSHYFKIAYGK